MFFCALSLYDVFVITLFCNFNNPTLSRMNPFMHGINLIVSMYLLNKILALRQGVIELFLNSIYTMPMFKICIVFLFFPRSGYLAPLFSDISIPVMWQYFPWSI